MALEDVKGKLASANLGISTEARNGNETGDQLRLVNGAIVNVFDNGTVDVQGKNQGPVREALGMGPRRAPAKVTGGNGKNAGREVVACSWSSIYSLGYT